MISQEVLLAFVQAATQGSFSAAARKLGRSQSTISAAVASLEIDLDLLLFDRSSRKAGERFALQRVQATSPQGFVQCLLLSLTETSPPTPRCAGH